MTYVADTTALLGLSFFPSAVTDAESVLSDLPRSLVTTPTAAFVYCTRNVEMVDVTPSTTTDSAASIPDSVTKRDVNWAADKGSFGETLTALRTAQTNFDLQLYAVDPDDLTVTVIRDCLVEETGLGSCPEDMAEEFTEELTAYFDTDLGDDVFTHTEARRAVDRLYDAIYGHAYEMKRVFAEAVPLRTVPSDGAAEEVRVERGECTAIEYGFVTAVNTALRIGNAETPVTVLTAHTQPYPGEVSASDLPAWVDVRHVSSLTSATGSV